MEYDPELPITQRLAEIGQALSSHQVVVVAGETGSGKSTQLPKLCLQLGRERIAHTQPRRIAARSVAERIAEETGTRLGEVVGYQVRFTKKTGRHTRLKVMTDGILLAEINRDRDLRAYDTIIIDEAHERSLTIDFLLGYLKRLITRRRDLKIIITSATIDTARFATHFNDAPIIEVSGRTYPVDVRYRPLVDEETGEAIDQVDGICAAVTELSATTTGDLLVFLSGEREIRDAAEALAAQRLPNTDIMPLYSRLSAAEQHRIFQPHSARRIVLATNVAETSLTVPGIMGVIDTGTARISRYSARTKVQRLPIEPISQASANQRAGRCGRIAPGVCIRLYSQDDFLARPQFTEPEIMRTNLASVILHMGQAKLGDIDDFPFVEAPDRSRINDGIRLLTELGAIHPPRRGSHAVKLTRIGHQLAQLPIDPRLGRMVLAAGELGCLREVLVIVAGLAIQDPRERPSDQQQAADESHQRFWKPLGAADAAPDRSDFMAWYRLWQYIQQQRALLSGNGFRRLCQREFLNFLRIREWQDLHNQLQDIARDIGLSEREVSADPDAIHQALLTGLLSNIGLADVRGKPRNAKEARTRGPRQYLGTRGTKFSLSPGSSLSGSTPELVVAAEIVETTRAWARCVATVDAKWVEQAAGRLVSRSYSEPHFSPRHSSVVAREKTSLWGVPLVADRIVNYARVDPVVARELFIRHGLVEQQWRTRHTFFDRNRRLRHHVESLAERTRQVGVDDDAVFAFYDHRIPDHVCSGASFDRWWKDHGDDGTLDLTQADLVSSSVDLTGYPDHWVVNGHAVPISYVWSPGDSHDGVTVEIDLELIHNLPAEPFTWQVPGLREELVTALLRGLPKRIRTQLVPIPDTAREVLAGLDDPHVAITTAISAYLRRHRGVIITDDEWATVSLPDHLEVGFRIVDADGHQVASGKNLKQLQSSLTEQASSRLTQLLPVDTATMTGARSWTFGTLPDRLTAPGGVLGWPALRDDGDTVSLAVADSPRRQQMWHRLGLRRLVMLNTPDPTMWTVAHLSNADKLALQLAPEQKVPEVIGDAWLAAVGTVVDSLTDPLEVRDQASFLQLCDNARQYIGEQTLEMVKLAAQVLRLWSQAMHAAAELPSQSTISDDVHAQLADLVFPGFLAFTPHQHVLRFPVYLTAVLRRIESWQTVGEAKDLALLQQFWEAEQIVADLVDLFPAGALPPQVDDVGWLLEEFRVSLFAQQLGTRTPVSVKRIRRAAAEAPQSWTA